MITEIAKPDFFGFLFGFFRYTDNKQWYRKVLGIRYLSFRFNSEFFRHEFVSSFQSSFGRRINYGTWPRKCIYRLFTYFVVIVISELRFYRFSIDLYLIKVICVIFGQSRRRILCLDSDLIHYWTKDHYITFVLAVRT